MASRTPPLTLVAPGDLLTVREVAKRLRVCTATVYKLIADKKLRAVRFGGSFLRVRIRDLAALAQESDR